MNKKLSYNKISWDVCLFFALYVVAPSYCAIELSSKLPLITLSRALLILMGAMVFLRRRNDLFRDIRCLNFGLIADPLLCRGLFLYFILLTVCDLVLFLSYPTVALKAMFVLVLEGYVLVWLLTLILDTREKIEAVLRLLVLASGITALLVMVGCAYSFHPFHILNLVEREIPMIYEYRMGMLRAEAGFGHPCYYGAFCAIMTPLNMYFIEHSHKKWERKLFALCLAMTLTGVVLSNARGSFLTVGFVVLVAVIRSFQHKKFRKFLRTYIPIVIMVIIFLLIVSSFTPVGPAFLLGFVKSILNIVFPNISMDIVVNTPIAEMISEVATEAIVEGATESQTVFAYGTNAGGLDSRLLQLKGIEWTLTQKPLFGFGHNAHVRGAISYQYEKNVWTVADTFDIGIVAIICQYGIVGLIGYLALFGSVLKAAFSRFCLQDPLMRYLGLTMVTYLVHLLTIATLEKMLWVLIASIVCLYNVLKKDL